MDSKYTYAWTARGRARGGRPGSSQAAAGQGAPEAAPACRAASSSRAARRAGGARTARVGRRACPTAWMWAPTAWAAAAAAAAGSSSPCPGALHCARARPRAPARPQSARRWLTGSPAVQIRGHVLQRGTRQHAPVGPRAGRDVVVCAGGRALETRGQRHDDDGLPARHAYTRGWRRAVGGRSQVSGGGGGSTVRPGTAGFDEYQALQMLDEDVVKRGVSDRRMRSFREAPGATSLVQLLAACAATACVLRALPHVPSLRQVRPRLEG